MNTASDNPALKVLQLGSLNQRKKYNNDDLKQFDILRNVIPTQAGSLSRMNGIKYLTEITGEPVIGFCQTNDSRGSIFVQTQFSLYQFTSEEFFQGPTYNPDLSSAALQEEETMALAIIAHQLAANTNGGAMANNTNWQQAPLSAIVQQLNPDGTAAAFAAVAANQITLQSGTYRVRGWSKGSVAATTTRLRARLYNVTLGQPVWNGAANETSDEGFADVASRNKKMEIGGMFTIAAPTIFEIQNKASVATGSSDFGQQANDGNKEIYRWLEILKTA